MMCSTCFEPKGSSSGKLLYVQVWYNLFTCNGISNRVGERVPTPVHVKHTIPYCTYNRLPEDEPLGSKHVER